MLKFSLFNIKGWLMEQINVTKCMHCRQIVCYMSCKLLYIFVYAHLIPLKKSNSCIFMFVIYFWVFQNDDVHTNNLYKNNQLGFIFVMVAGWDESRNWFSGWHIRKWQIPPSPAIIRVRRILISLKKGGWKSWSKVLNQIFTNDRRFSERKNAETYSSHLI